MSPLPSQDATRRWLPTAALVVGLHVIALLLLVQMKSEPATPVSLPGHVAFPGGTGGIAPTPKPGKVYCTYAAGKHAIKLVSIRDETQDRKAICPDLTRNWSPTYDERPETIRITLDVAHTGRAISAEISGDGGNHDVASNIRSTLSKLQYATPPDMNATSSPITYVIAIEFEDEAA